MINLTTITDALKAGFAALQAPADNPVAALFAIASMVLVLLIGVLVVYLALISVESRREPSGPAPSAPRSPSADARRRILRLVLGLVALAALTYVWDYSTSDAACARCHFTKRAIDSHADGTHSDTACSTCHVGPGLSAAVQVRLRGLDNAVTQLSGEPEDMAPTRVPNGACLSCHANVLEGVTVARSIRIRHSDLLEIGHACTDCHNTEGHGKEVARAQYPRMGLCIACHDGERAPAECDVCHSEDVGVAVRRLERPFAQISTGREDCRGCHPMDTCIACHGLELPHSDDFIRGYHALKGYTQTRMCLGCHDLKAFCNGCHQFQVKTNGATSWPRYHISQGEFVVWHSNPNNPGIRECACHELDRKKFCNYCHGPQPER